MRHDSKNDVGYDRDSVWTLGYDMCVCTHKCVNRIVDLGWRKEGGSLASLCPDPWGRGVPHQATNHGHTPKEQEQLHRLVNGSLHAMLHANEAQGLITAPHWVRTVFLWQVPARCTNLHATPTEGLLSPSLRPKFSCSHGVLEETEEMRCASFLKRKRREAGFGKWFGGSTRADFLKTVPGDP